MNVETQVHLTTLRQLVVYRLHELRTEIHALDEARAQSLADIGGAQVIDRKEQASDEQRADVSDEDQARLRVEEQAFERALQRLDAGEYGDCVDCQEPIPWQRLMVQPAAERCAPCQRRMEKGGALAPARA